MSEKKQKKSFFETPLMSSKIKSSNVSLFPEAGLGYLLGPLLALICNGVVNIWLIQYWDKVLGLGEWNPLFETLLPIISAILIVAGNIMVGRLMERKPSIAGKARPLILLGMPAVAVSLLLLFLVPFPAVGAEGAYHAGMSFADVMFDNGGLVASIFVAVGYNLFYALAWPIYYTSHSALVNLSTRNGGSRGLLSTCIMAAQLGAAGLSGMAGGLLVDLLGLMPKYQYTEAYLLLHPEITEKSTSDFAMVKDLLPGSYTVEITRAQANEKWTILMIVMIVALVLGCLLEYFFTRERITEEAVKNAEAAAANGEVKKEIKSVPMSKQIAVCMKDKYWWIIIIFFFLYQFGGQMKNNAMSFYSAAMTGEYAVSSLINTVGAIPTAVGMVLVWPIANKITKSKTILAGGIMAFVCGLIAYIPLFMASPSVGTISTISVISFCLKALGTAPAMYISLALLANMLDHQEAVYGIRTDGFTMAVYGSIMVAMAGVCNGVIVGLKSAIPGDGKFLMTTLAFGVEAVCYLIMAGLMIFMNVEKYTKADNLAIIADQKSKVLAEGGEWIEPEERARLEEEENARLVEEARVAQLKADCEKKGLNYDEEEAKYQEKKAAADAAAAEKKAAAEAKKQAAYDALTPEQKEAKAQKEAAAKAKADADLEVAIKELDGIREANKALRESLAA